MQDLSFPLVMRWQIWTADCDAMLGTYSLLAVSTHVFVKFNGRELERAYNLKILCYRYLTDRTTTCHCFILQVYRSDKYKAVKRCLHFFTLDARCRYREITSMLAIVDNLFFYDGLLAIISSAAFSNKQIYLCAYFPSNKLPLSFCAFAYHMTLPI